MHKFTDTAGREWQIALTIGSVKKLRDQMQIDLLNLEVGEPPLLTRLTTDVVLQIDVIFALVESQAKAAGVTDTQFGEALGGDAAFEALQAFQLELVAFFQSLHRGEVVDLIMKAQAMMRATIEAAQAKLARVDVNKVVAAVAAAMDGKSSTNLPGLSDAIPGPSPSAS